MASVRRDAYHPQRAGGRGHGTPTTGPFDIVLENGTIVDMVPLDPVAVRNGNAKRPEGAAEIDATGKYVLPGLINIHGHHPGRAGRGGATATPTRTSSGSRAASPPCAT